MTISSQNGTWIQEIAKRVGHAYRTTPLAFDYGDATVAKYMADAGSYDRITYEATNSRYAKGAAEIVTARLVELLREP
ncbi:hypothetical protein OG226_08575 [Streptomyces sp. NBC_01261]|uniref:hypothetical protein n=1 Tax=Streptomyces sp. NBC_01261 TaxID=2903802 RepID=UPI002E2FB3CA|nr:hypothetical protein [Streptomyces sp. NBC_01261]